MQTLGSGCITLYKSTQQLMTQSAGRMSLVVLYLQTDFSLVEMKEVLSI
jgi:hypothetical protein